MSIDDLSYKKVATQSHTFIGTGYSAGNAVDGNPATCMSTKDIGGNSEYKTAWWKVDLGHIHIHKFATFTASTYCIMILKTSDTVCI